MTATTRRQRGAHIPAHALPARQSMWTRLGNAMGYTDTEAKRAEIRAVLAHLVWVDPCEMADVLDAAPVRHAVAGLFYQRRWALHSAGIATLPDDVAGRQRRLIALESISGERYALLSTGYEVIDLLHDRPTVEEVLP